MADLYLRKEGDPRFQDNKIENVDVLEEYLEQIEVLLFTRKGDVLGEKDMGCNLEDLIYNFSLSEGPIKTAIFDQISSYCPRHKVYNTDVKVNFYKGTDRDIAVVDIIVNNNLVAGIIMS